jgi:large subunit ribosomal protein L25
MAQKTIPLSAQPREKLGTRQTRRLRDAGLLPGVIYGHKEAIVPVAVNKKEILDHVAKGAHVFDLNLPGDKLERVLIKEAQYNHLGNDIVHLDFTRVSLDEKVTLTVSLELKGEPEGEKEGAVLSQIIAELEIECLVTDIPSEIVHNVSKMKKDDVLHIKDLTLPPGVKVLQDEDLVVATLYEIKEEEPAEAAAAEGGEPEVVKKGKDEEGAAAPAAETK